MSEQEIDIDDEAAANILNALEEIIEEDEESDGWDPKTIVFYGKKNRAIVISGDIDSELTLGICSQILELAEQDPEAPIRIFINTEGGSVIDALSIYDILKSITCPVITIVSGACMSAGLIILAAGDVRTSYPNSLFFYHQTILDTIEIDCLEKGEAHTFLYQWSQDKCDGILLERSKMNKELWEKEFKGRVAKPFDAQSALKYGLIDHLLEAVEKAPLNL